MLPSQTTRLVQNAEGWVASIKKEVKQQIFYCNLIKTPIPGVKTTIIYPATEKHIAKFSQQQTHIVLETPELYLNLTLPYIQKEQFNLQVMVF